MAALSNPLAAMSQKNSILAVIPARLKSTRFPEKPLALIAGKPMIQRVYERVQMCSAIDKIIVATDSEKILKTVLDFGGNAEMTDVHHASGSDRVQEVVARNPNVEIAVNIQGDEPLIHSQSIERVIQLFNDPECMIATSAIPIQNHEDYLNPNIVKVVLDKNSKALYFSRSPIPMYREHFMNRKLSPLKHLGLYAYRPAALRQIAELPECPLEQDEKLEQLRFLFNGISVYVAITQFDSIGVDRPEDIHKIEQLLRTSTG